MTNLVRCSTALARRAAQCRHCSVPSHVIGSGRTALALLLLVAAFAAKARAVTIDWSPVGNPGNAGELSGIDGYNGAGPNAIVGAVPYSYRIGTYDVTNSQYVDFLNAKDPAGYDTLALYNSQMSTDTVNGGISFIFARLYGHKYTTVPGRENWSDCEKMARRSRWMWRSARWPWMGSGFLSVSCVISPSENRRKSASTI